MITYTENDFKASVGKYGREGRPCYNTTGDQEIVQYLLNRIPAEYGGADGKLHTPPLWGRISPELQQAIERFQAAHAIDEGLFRDGHVDPHDRTIRALLTYAYHRLYQWPDDTQDTTPPPTHKEILPTSGIKISDVWIRDVSEDFAERGVDLPNGVRLPLPPRGLIWPRHGTRITVNRVIDKDGKIQYNVILSRHDASTDPVVHEAEKLATKEIVGQGPSRAASAGLWMMPRTVGAAGGSVLGVLIPTNGGAEKIWSFRTTEGSASCQVNGMTNFDR